MDSYILFELNLKFDETFTRVKKCPCVQDEKNDAPVRKKVVSNKCNERPRYLPWALY